jgi:hypothetical protein
MWIIRNKKMDDICRYIKVILKVFRNDTLVRYEIVSVFNKLKRFVRIKIKE